MHTKVQETLSRFNYPYTVREHAAFEKPIKSPVDFAEALKYDLGRITKSLYLKSTGANASFAVAVCGMDRKLNLAMIATHLSVKRVSMASRSELLHRLGYPPTGVSPLGAGDTPILMDQALLDWPTILIGGGMVGVEIELEPHHLAAMSGAILLPVTETD